MAEEKVFTLDEIAQHNKKNDLYLLVHGKVYSLSKFLDEHPGGDEVILQEGGKDATEAFEDVGHSDEAREIMKEYLVGVCNEAPSKSSLKAKSSTKIANTAGGGSNVLSYFIPLAVLVAYVAYRFYSS